MAHLVFMTKGISSAVHELLHDGTYHSHRRGLRQKKESAEEREHHCSPEVTKGLACLFNDRVEDENQDLRLMEFLYAYWLKRMMPISYLHHKRHEME